MPSVRSDGEESVLISVDEGQSCGAGRWTRFFERHSPRVFRASGRQLHRNCSRLRRAALTIRWGSLLSRGGSRIISCRRYTILQYVPTEKHNGRQVARVLSGEQPKGETESYVTGNKLWDRILPDRYIWTLVTNGMSTLLTNHSLESIPSCGY